MGIAEGALEFACTAAANLAPRNRPGVKEFECLGQTRLALTVVCVDDSERGCELDPLWLGAV
ncbi:hypothetical protein FHT44_006196 [Mycolicibacterium sp. BK634]|nr:hypothetical protein [Mycolicibacterium sp. BK634]